MTNGEKTNEARADLRRVSEDIFDAALLSARLRLKDIDHVDVEDSMAFDRIARTALSLVRVASEIDALAARKLKEIENNERTGARTEDDINRIEAELAGRLSRHARDLAEQFSARGLADGARDSASGRT
ncbi:MAG: hypothetical protein U5J99_14965 [Parvularculaceae bacterium]|nr:hypothetical protein [Parvularculaceae bacterium]